MQAKPDTLQTAMVAVAVVLVALILGITWFAVSKVNGETDQHRDKVCYEAAGDSPNAIAACQGIDFDF